MEIALEPPPFLVARTHDARSRLLHLSELEPHLDPEAGNLDREARGRKDAAEQIGAIEQNALVPEEPDLLPAMLHRGHGALAAGWPRDHRPEAIGVRVALGQPEEQLGTRVAKGLRKHGADVFRLPPPLADVVDERAHPL